MSDLIVLNEENANVYDRLVVSLEAGLGTLQILIAVCDNSALKQELIKRYEAELEAEGVRVYRLALNPDEPSLLQALIDGKMDMKQQAIATVLGAEKLSDLGADNRERLDSFLGYLQWTREALRRYPLPIVLWLPSALLVEIAKKAPDFWSWRGGTFNFGFAKLDFSKLVLSNNRDFRLAQSAPSQSSSSVLSVRQLEDSLAEAIKTWGEDSSNTEPVYAQLGKLYADRVWKGETDNRERETVLAETYLMRAIDIQKTYKLRTDLIYSLNSLAYMYKFLGYWDKAEALYKESLVELREELNNKEGIAMIWGQLGDIERKRGNWDAAESLYRQSLQLRTELGDRAGMAESWGLLGDIERNRGNWDAAESLFRQSLQLRTELGDRAGMAESWGLLGDIERNRGNWDAAESLFRQSLQLRTELGDRAGMAMTWGSLGDIERNRGNWDAAESLFRQSLQLRTELGDRAGMAMTWGALGYIESRRGNWDAAESLYRQCLAVEEELGDRAGMATSWGLLGDVERNRGNWDAAESLYRQSLQLRTELGDRAGIAMAWGVLGDIERNRGNWDAALEFFLNALTFKENLMGLDHPEVADLLVGLGSIYQQQQSYDQAEAYFSRALTIRKQKLGLNHPETKKIRMVLNGLQQIKDSPEAGDLMTSLMSLMQQKPELASTLQQSVAQRLAATPDADMEDVMQTILFELAKNDPDLKKLITQFSELSDTTIEM
ncbi:MAG: tetratricopeptide repeat protein [Pseudanabaena sp.]